MDYKESFPGPHPLPALEDKERGVLALARESDLVTLFSSRASCGSAKDMNRSNTLDAGARSRATRESILICSVVHMPSCRRTRLAESKEALVLAATDEFGWYAPVDKRSINLIRV